MTSAIPYDPEDFDNNPFAEQSTHSLIPDEQPQQAVADGTITAQPGPQDAPLPTAIPATQSQSQSQSQPQPQPQPQAAAAAAPQPQPPQSSIDDTTAPSALNRKPTEAELKKFIPEKYLKGKFSISVQVVDVEKNGSGSSAYKNPILQLSAVVNGLPGYRKTSYKAIRRTYKELELFNKYLQLNNLEVFVPALPTIPTLYNAGSDEFNASVVESVQLWFDRVCANAILVKNTEFVLFLENGDFQYSPSRTKPSNIVMATGLRRKTLKQMQLPYDECQELAALRPLVKATYVNASHLKESLQALDKADRRIAGQNTDFHAKLADLGAVESDDAMKKAWLKLSRNLGVVNEIDLVKKHTTHSLLTEYLNLLIDDTYTIKESLTNRHLLMRELIGAEESAKRRHATIAKLRNKSPIDPSRVDEAIIALEQATLAEKKLRRDVIRTTYNMLLEEEDYLEFLTAETRRVFKRLAQRTIEHERKKLAVLENFRNDVREISTIKGGLARLGRENYPVSPTRQPKSQTSAGDSWNSRAKKRGGEFVDADDVSVDEIVDQLGTAAVADDADDDTGSVVDARSAASLLGPSTF